MNRFPIADNDWTNPGFLFKILLDRMLTSEHATTSLYLFKYTPGQIVRHNRRYYFNLNTPMGVNTVAGLFPALCQLAGVEGRKTPHMMRTFVATRLANDPKVSPAEVAAALRHSSLASQAAYLVPTVDSEVNRSVALGGVADSDDAKPAAKPAAKPKPAKRSKPLKKKKKPKNAPTMAAQPYAAAPFGFGFNPMAAAFMQQQAMMAMMMPPQGPTPQGPTPASLAAAGLTQEQIDAVFALEEDSSSDEE